MSTTTGPSTAVRPSSSPGDDALVLTQDLRLDLHVRVWVQHHPLALDPAIAHDHTCGARADASKDDICKVHAATWQVPALDQHDAASESTSRLTYGAQYIAHR